MKKKIRYIFELRFAPNLSSFLFNFETWARIRPLKRFLNHVDPKEEKRIIDVGAGTGRLEKALNRKDIFIYDNNEHSIIQASSYFPNTKTGSGSKIDYKDNSFDWAISIHTLEHISNRERPDFLLELIRISGEGVFLNFPEGENARLLCINFLKALEKNDLEPNKWTLEHLEMGLPKIEELFDVLSKQSKFIFKHKYIRNYKIENIYWEKVRASNNILIKYFLSPFLSIWSYFLYYKKPTIELLLLGTKSENFTNNILKKL